MDDPQYDEARVPQYAELSKQCLSAEALKAKVIKERKAEEKVLFAMRQKKIAELAAQEAAYQAQLRKIDLDRMRVAVEEKKQQDIDQEKDVVERTHKDVATMRANEMAFAARQKVIETNEMEFYLMEQSRRRQVASEGGEFELKKKAEREAKAASIQESIKQRMEASEKAQRTFTKRSKAELAAETRKGHEIAAKKDATRTKEGAAGRMANISYMNTHADRLHWEPPPSPVHLSQYAKELRERSDSPTGK